MKEEEQTNNVTLFIYVIFIVRYHKKKHLKLLEQLTQKKIYFLQKINTKCIKVHILPKAAH